MDSNPPEYTTTDFYTAALLISQKYEVLRVSREGPRFDSNNQGKTRRFHFEDSPELQKDIMDFMNNKKTGSLRDYRDAIEITKDLIHS